MTTAQAMLPGYEHAPQAHDFISTPRNVTERLLHFCPLPPGPVVEPCAGAGAIVEVLLEHGKPADDVSAVEIRPEERFALCGLLRPSHVCTADWLEAGGYYPPGSALVTNPPFSKLPEMLPHFFPFAYVALLLPIEELAGKQSSHRVLQKLGAPTDLVPIPWRPWPCVRGVAWFVWRQGREGTALWL